MKVDYTQKTDAELNVEVARRLGWTKTCGSRAGGLNGTSPDGKFGAVPSWSTDIGAAWELLGTLEETQRPFSMCDTYEGLNRVGVTVELLNHTQRIAATDAKPARAIVLAWLLAMDAA